MKIAAPLGHVETVRGLWRAAASGRLAHALCFEGPAGCGKFAAARWFVAGLVCERGPLRDTEGWSEESTPCGECRACKQLASGGALGNHPDVHVVDRAREQAESAGRSGYYQGAEITVAHVAAREGDGGKQLPVPPIAEFLMLKPSESTVRCVLIREAERMNASAQNAFLKTLEEPAPGTHLVLESSRPGALMATIRSRVVRVAFAPLVPADAQVVLREACAERELGNVDLERLVALGEGSPGRALELAERGAFELDALLVAWLAGGAPPDRTARALWEVEGRFPGSTQLALERERVATILARSVALVREALGLCLGLEPSGILGPEETGQLADLSRREGRAGCERRLERLLELGADLDRNLDPATVLDRLLYVPLGSPSLARS